MNSVEIVGARSGTTIVKNSRAIEQPSIFALSKISTGSLAIEPEKSTIGYFIYSQAKAGNYKYPSAIGLLVSVIVVPVVLGLRAISSKFFEEDTF